ncbi:kinase-like domain-containing protein [Scleroderma yunnanense]
MDPDRHSPNPARNASRNQRQLMSCDLQPRAAPTTGFLHQHLYVPSMLQLHPYLLPLGMLQSHLPAQATSAYPYPPYVSYSGLSSVGPHPPPPASSHSAMNPRSEPLESEAESEAEPPGPAKKKRRQQVLNCSECSLKTPPIHKVNHGSRQIVVNPSRCNLCTPLGNYFTKKIQWFLSWDTLVAVFWRALARILIPLKKYLGQRNGPKTLLMRAARYSSNLDDEIDHNDHTLTINTGNSLIYQGVLRTSGIRVAIKTIIWHDANSDAIKRTLREVHVLSKLRHDNVLPLLGITTIPNRMVSIVTEWMPRGNAHDYVQATTVDPRPLIVGIARGLFYLHSHVSGPIIHGDLKGMNVLISAQGRALLTDFGHSHLTNSSFSMTVNPPCGGSLNWLAPENVESDQYAITLPGDIWAFGMTALELFSREKPFHGLRNVPAILWRISFGPLPERPNDECTCSRMTDAWWTLCSLCWERDPSLRPEISVIMKQLNHMWNTDLQ